MLGFSFDQLGLVLFARSDGYERVLALAALAWALTLAVPGQPPDAASALPSPAFAPSWPWALAGALVAGLHIVGLATRRLDLRFCAAWTAMPFWWSLFALCAPAFGHEVAIGFFLVHAMLSSWVCVQLTGERYGGIR